MPITVNVHEAKTHFSRLLEQAHAGQEIVLAKAGKPYARLMPLAPTGIKRQPGRLAGRVAEDFLSLCRLRSSMRGKVNEVLARYPCPAVVAD